MLEPTQRLLDRISHWIGISIAWLTFAMVVVTCIVVIGRYLLDAGSIGLQESVVYMHVIVIMLGIPYTLKEGAHVRVDIIYQRLTRRQRAIVDLTGTIIFLAPVSLFILWGSLDYVRFSWSLGEGSAEPGGLPGVYVLKTLIPLMAGLLLLQGIAEAIKSLRILTGSAAETPI